MSMNLILENIIKNRNNHKFNFSKSLNENIYNTPSENSTENLPISVRASSWEETQNKFGIKSLNRVYNFSSSKHQEYFLIQCLRKSNNMNHAPYIEIYEMKTYISLYTKDLNEITESDIHLSKFLDEVFNDIKSIQEL